MRTDNMSDEYYNSIIYTKEELELEFWTWKHKNIEPKRMKDYMNWAQTNNWYVSTIENYEIYKKMKSDRLINYANIRTIF